MSWPKVSSKTFSNLFGHSKAVFFRSIKDDVLARTDRFDILETCLLKRFLHRLHLDWPMADHIDAAQESNVRQIFLHVICRVSIWTAARPQ